MAAAVDGATETKTSSPGVTSALVEADAAALDAPIFSVFLPEVKDETA